MLGGPEALEELHAHTGINLLAVSGLPPSPATEFDEVEPGLIVPTAEQPAYQPPVRDLISLLLRELPSQELNALALIAAQAGGMIGTGSEPVDPILDEDGVPIAPGRVVAADTLRRVPSEAFDRPLDIPLFFINPFERKAPVVDAVEKSRARFRDDLPELAKIVRERASSEKKLEAQFAAWDAREGWAAGRYDEALEISNKRAAVRNQAGSESSATDAYKAAFFYIFGTAYTPDMRLKLHAEVRAWLLPAAERDGYLSRNGKKATSDSNRARRPRGGQDAAAKWVTDAGGLGGDSLSEDRASQDRFTPREDPVETAKLAELEKRVRAALSECGSDAATADRLSALLNRAISPDELESVRDHFGLGRTGEDAGSPSDPD
ncbi:hypothetical protein [Alienimonas californiensis]|uniref:hypothetical protein n=1 Tax=Alienimonas californiensis TaxID=2527989 RepID=UPI0011A9F0F1|nr:hypothetical protein [Alienimonas californiensis]